MLTERLKKKKTNKQTIGLISKKQQLHVQHTSSLLFCTTATWNFQITRFMNREQRELKQTSFSSDARAGTFYIPEQCSFVQISS